MADKPTPRSYSQILGSMIRAFQAKYPIEEFRVGGPLLTMLEAAAQSDFRATVETLNLFAATTLASASGTALDRIAADENTIRRGASPSSGTIVVTDSRYTKVLSTILTSKPAPSVNSSVIYIANGAGFPASGQIYIGRTTVNYEGPISYDSISEVNLPYGPWTEGPARLVLNGSTPTSKFHNWGETVILAQGGNRLVAAGAVAQTPKGTAQSQYSVVYPVTLLDGEVEIDGVQVSCTRPGVIGNVPIHSITDWQSPPFSGAKCTNIVPFTNGLDVESDEKLRERILNLRQSRSRATSLAIRTYLNGIQALDENKRIISSSVLAREGEPTTVYIDDGSGYEEVSSGVANEWLNESATGGEQYFQLSYGRPVAKASLKTQNTSPFNITPNTDLTVHVGGVEYVHQFEAAHFRSPSNATAWEVAHSINSDPDVAFTAKTEDGGQTVVITAKADTNEDIQVMAGGANDALLFPLHLAQSCYLYKNDVLLNKDGDPAKLYSNPQAEWIPDIVDGATLDVSVDGTGINTYTFHDSDFVNVHSEYYTVASGNSLLSWCKVLESRIPGISATTVDSKILLTSNASSDRGSLEISGGSLVSSGMFNVGVATAKAQDYTLNRNTGQLKLTVPLEVGDKLEVGSFAPKAFIESLPLTTVNAVGDLYFVIDGNAQIIQTTVSGNSTLTFTTTFADAGNTVRYVEVIGTAGMFTNVLAGDWAIFSDPVFVAGAVNGIFRVADVASDRIYFEANAADFANQAGVPYAPASAGFAIVRSSDMIQKVSLNGVYTPTTLALAISSQLRGAEATVSRTQYVRVSTDTYGGEYGEVALVMATGTTTVIGFPVKIVPSNDSQQGMVESASSDFDFPMLWSCPQATTTSTNTTELISTYDLITCGTLVGLKHLNWPSVDGYDSKIGYASQQVSSSLPHTLRIPLPSRTSWFIGSRFYDAVPWALTPDDDLGIVIDGENIFKSFSINFGHGVSSSGAYTQTGLTLLDETGDGHLATFFGGTTFDLNDWALWMRARGLSHEGQTYSILWRYYKPGPAGQFALLRYQYPTEASQIVKVVPDYTTTSEYPACEITLGSGPARSLPNLENSMHIGVALRGLAPTGTRGRKYIVAGLTITQLDRLSGVVTAHLNSVDGAGWGKHGLQIGDRVYVNVEIGTPLTWASGSFIITNVNTLNNTISYSDGLLEADGSSGAGTWGNVTFNVAGGADFASVAVDDIVYIQSTATGLSSSLRIQPLRVVSKPQGDLVLEVYSEEIPVTNDTVNWGTNILGDTTRFTAFPLTDGATLNTVNTIVSNVNAQVGAMVTAQAVVPGDLTVINRAGWDVAPSYSWQLTDSINYVSSWSVVGSDYVINLKDAVTAGAGTFWNSEDLWLVPVTSKNVADYLNLRNVSALPENGIAQNTSAGGIQIITNTIGSNGSVKVSGGLANSMAADVRGAASDSNGSFYVYISSAQSKGLHAVEHQYVELENSEYHIKTNAVSTANLTSIAGSTFTVSSSVTPNRLDFTGAVSIERRGRFMFLITDTNLGSPISNGGWLVVNNASVNNKGTFRILHSGSSASLQWYVFENDFGLDEHMASCSFSVMGPHDMMPGDRLVIGTDSWGVANRREFTINTIASNGLSFTTVEVPSATGAVAGPQPLIKLYDSQVLKVMAQLNGLAPHPTDTSLTGVIFANYAMPFDLFTESLGTKIVNPRKFDFSTTPSVGIDAYRYNVGLIGEANKVLYGDETDTATYPGVIAAGANINISGPSIRRITVALALRLRTGAVAQQVFDGVRNTITTYINSLKVGESIAISKIIATAEKVGGVAAITVIYPTYNVGSDLITVQAYEKPLILSPDEDIMLSIVE